MKICDLTQFYSPVSGGVRRYIEQKAAFLRAERPNDEHVLTVPGETTACHGDSQARIYSVASPLVSRTSRYRALLKLHLVEEALERERPDIIESSDPYQLAWKAVASGRGLGIPVVGFYHSHFPEAILRSVAAYFGPLAVSMAEDIGCRYVKTLYNHFEKTFVPSPVLAQLLTDWGVQRVEKTDLGVDTNIFHPSDEPPWKLRKTLQIPPSGRLLLYVGRLGKEKNVTTLFQAFEILNATDPGLYHLLIVGDGNQRAGVLDLRHRLGNVTWLPYCENPLRLAEIYRAADLLVHPSIQETFGLTALESQASGTSVVGIRGSYMDRIIFSGQLHWATANTPEALAAAIAGKYRSDLRRSGLLASQTARNLFSWKNIFSRLFSIYENVVASYNG